LSGWGSFDLLSEIQRCLEMLSSSLPNPAMVCVPEHTVALNGSPGSFRRLILNLVSNAVRHSESESIRISIEPYPTDPDLVVVEVSDDGKGIPAALLQNLGEPLFLADLEHRERFFVKGTGLGLFICRRIVAEFEGRIIVSSGTDRGTRVRLFLRRNLSTPVQECDLAPIEFEVLP
jgi:signal transduction histidine kinase